MSLKIFCDKHHQALFESFKILFEDRLGHTIYEPYGMDWYPDYWKLGDPYGEAGRFTAQQYLESVTPRDGTQVLHPYRGITLEEFKETKFDIVIASYNDHVQPYYNLIQMYQPQAKLIEQIGNEWSVHPLVKNVMASIKPFETSVNTVFYHQEFSIKIFKPDSLIDHLHINSFVNALNLNDLFKQDYEDFKAVRQAFPDYYVKSYGGGCEDGSYPYPYQIAEKLKKTYLMLHFKQGGDGYGYNLYTAAACGVPIIFKGSQYKGKLGEELLEHGVTGIDYEIIGSPEALYSYVKNNGDLIEQMRVNIYNRFKEKVNFDQEAENIKRFLQRLV